MTYRIFIALLSLLIASSVLALDREYAIAMANMFELDQKLRNESHITEEAHRASTDLEKKAELQDVLKDLYARTNENDRANQKEFDKLVGKFGWPTSEKVGRPGMMATLLVIQHADLSYQLKYAPQLQASAALGEISRSSYALFVDRLALRQNRMQVYGTQVDTKDGVTLRPVENESELDKRRKEIGLAPVCEYLRNFVAAYGNITYPACLNGK